MRLFQTVIITACLLLAATSIHAQTQQLPKTPAEWTQAYEPYRMVGNLYYVGTYDLAAYLIATPSGHILVNTGIEPHADLVKASVEKLGFRVSDIKIILTNQVHNDHVSGIAEMKRLTEAKVLVDKADAKVLADGGASDHLFGGHGELYTPVKADRLLNDHDLITLGGVKLTMLHHPGHTKGSCAFLLDVKDKGKTYKVLLENMPSILPGAEAGMPAYPAIDKDYAYTLEAMRTLKFDLWMAAHASQFGMHGKHKPGDPYNPEAFRDQAGYVAMVDSFQRQWVRYFGK